VHICQQKMKFFIKNFASESQCKNLTGHHWQKLFYF